MPLKGLSPDWGVPYCACLTRSRPPPLLVRHEQYGITDG